MKPTTGIDLTNWLTKAETASRLQISERSLDRLVAGGRGPERRYRQIPDRRPEPVFNPADVERLAGEANPPMLIAPDSALAAPAGSRTLAVTRRGTPDPALVQLGAFFDRVVRLAREFPPAAEKLYLTIPEASAYTGLSQALLRRLVREKKVPAVRDRAVKIRRADLEEILVHTEVAHG